MSSIWLASEFQAAIAGAFVGAFVAAMFQLIFFQWEISRKKKEQIDHNKSQLSSLFFKIGEIHSNNVQLLEHLVECENECKRRGELGIKWNFSRPLAYVPTSPSISDSEKMALLSLKKRSNCWGCHSA